MCDCEHVRNDFFLVRISNKIKSMMDFLNMNGQNIVICFVVLQSQVLWFFFCSQHVNKKKNKLISFIYMKFMVCLLKE
jgi:hypothetical protein